MSAFLYVEPQLSLAFSILHMRSKPDEVSRAGTADWTDRPDWTNHFGAPIERGQKPTSKMLANLNFTVGPKHHLSRCRDTGSAVVAGLAELHIDDIYDVPRHPSISLAKVEIRQDVLQKVDTMSLEEEEDESKPRQS